MTLRTVQPRKPKTPRHAPGMHAAPVSHPSKGGMLSALTNLATVSGGTPPQGQQQQPTPWESDPVLQQIKALQASNEAAADAQAQAARQQALINFGYSDNLGKLYGDAGTAGAAQANPYSILKELEQSHQLRQRSLNENLNKANLFYSSTRGQELQNEGKQYLGEQYGAGQRLQGILSQIEGGRLGAHQNADAARQQAMENAYQRYLDQQLQYGLGAQQKGALHAAPVRHPHRRRMI